MRLNTEDHASLMSQAVAMLSTFHGTQVLHNELMAKECGFETHDQLVATYHVTPPKVKDLDNTFKYVASEKSVVFTFKNVYFSEADETNSVEYVVLFNGVVTSTI